MTHLNWYVKAGDEGIVSFEYGSAVGCLLMATILGPNHTTQTIATWLTEDQRRELAAVLLEELAPLHQDRNMTPH